MKASKIEIFLHSQGNKPTVQTVDLDERLVDVILRCKLIDKEGDEVTAFIGDCTDALSDDSEADDGEDRDHPADTHRKLGDLSLKHQCHVHCYRCRRVKVTAHFGNKDANRKFSPATTIATVTAWARKRFKLTDAAANDLVLQTCDTKIFPRADQYLGELKEAADCVICFNLVREVTPQGHR